MRKIAGWLVCLLMIVGMAKAQDDTLVVITHDSFNIDETLLGQFEEEAGIQVQILRAGDAGSMVNQAILTKDNPLGDVLYGVDNTFLGRALDAGIFAPYVSPELENISESFILSEENRVTPVDYGDVCLNYNIAYFADNNLPIPDTLEALTEEQYRGLLVVTNPATSSPGLAFMLATIAQFGTEGDYTWLDYWRDLVANEVLVADGWETAYYQYFVTEEYPMVLSYASSPPFTVDEVTGEATTASIVADGMCFRQIEYVGILKGTPYEAQAQAFVDFMIGQDFQAALPELMYVFPVREDVELPELFAEFAQIPKEPATLDSITIEENRDEWITIWIETVGQ